MRLRVDRPIRVERDGYGRWCWSCWLCPPPLCDVPTVARAPRTQQAALTDAIAHLVDNHCGHLTAPRVGVAA